MKKDVLLIARADHSYFIYQALLKSSLNYLYCTFKVLPSWVINYLKIGKIRSVEKYYSISYITTLLNILIYNLGWRRARKADEHAFSWHISWVLKIYHPRILHYWPDYCVELVSKYRANHSNVITMADIYMPSCRYVVEEMKSVLEKYGLLDNLRLYRDSILLEDKRMELEDNFVVPSSLVADSFNKYYPNKHFHVVSFGILKWNGYKKKNVPSRVYRFVYVGTISVEKGCDLLCEWFKKHSEYEVHLIGKIHSLEKDIFSKYSEINNIFFEGVFFKNEIQNKVREYDCGIHLSRFDAYSLAVAEMTSAGLPVVVSDHSGNFFDIQKNNLGEVASLDFESIDNAVKRIVDNYSLYLDNIDSFIRNDHYDYGTEVVKLYKRLLNG